MSLPDLWGALLRSGPIAVFLIFLSPFGPGAVAGIVLARSQGLAPGTTIGLYVLSDVVTAAILEPLVQRFRRWAHHSPIGQKLLASFARVASLTQVAGGRYGLPIGLFICTFATDFFTAAIISTGLALARLVAWTCIIAGDVLWFLIIFLASVSLAAFLSDNRILFVVTLIVGFGLPYLMRKLLGKRLAPPPSPPGYRPPFRFPPTNAAGPRRSRADPTPPAEDPGAR
jgi:hypothetical protein